MKIETLEQLKSLLKLLKSQEVDIFEMNGLKIVITKHEYVQENKKKESVEQPKSRQEKEDEILFYHENL